MKSFTENRKILYVDDEPELLNSFRALMRKENYVITTLQTPADLKSVLESEKEFAVVLSDQRMPGIDGVKVLETIKDSSPDSMRILVTGYADYKDTIKAINVSRIHSYISKPWDDDELKRQVSDWVSQFNLKKHNKYLLKLLDEENIKLNEVLDGTVASTVRILGDLANHLSPQIEEVSNRVKTLGTTILNVMPEVPPEERWQIMRAFDLFNIGIAFLPPAIQSLIAREGLSALQTSPLAAQHHLLAAGVIKYIPRFAPVARIIELQGKDFDGTGEPVEDMTSKYDLPLGSRLLHVLINLVRPVTKLRGTELLHFMMRQPGKYDPEIIRIFLGQHIQTGVASVEKMLPVVGLDIGMILVEDVRSLDGHLLLKANTILSETFINIIRQWHSRDPLVEPIKVRCME